MTRNPTRCLRFLLACLLLSFGPLVRAVGPVDANGDELLQPDQAFRLSATALDAGHVRLQWHIADGYYLYRSKFAIRSRTPGVGLGEPRFNTPEVKHDEFFGQVEVYHHLAEALVPVSHSGSTDLALEVRYQGCAERGVCYPPQTRTLKLHLAAAAPAAPQPPASQAQPAPAAPQPSASQAQPAPAAPASGQPAVPPAPKPAATAAKSTPGPVEQLGRWGQSLFSDQGGSEFLPVDQAFQLDARATGPDRLRAQWTIAEGYYLYRKKFSFEVQAPAGARILETRLPPGQVKHDEAFGRMEVYHKGVTADLRLAGVQPGQKVKLRVGYQGCAEKGICYPPQHRTLDLVLPAAAAANTGPVAAGTPPAPTPPAQGARTPTAPPAAPAAPVTEQDRLAQTLAHSSVLVSLITFFGLGLLLAFTPCVFPMIPILSGIIVGQGENINTRRAFVLSLVYVLAMAVTYTVAGVVAGLSGENLQAAFQNPWVLGTFAALFVLLALSMFGFYELQLPAALQTRLNELSNRQRSGSLLGVAVMGFLSALIVGPCVAPPLAGALIYISHTGDPVLGGLALFALSLGMGAPLILVGTGAGKLLPRAGGWMNSVKAVFGVLLLAVAIWMLERIVPAAVTMGLWAALMIGTAVYLGAFDHLPADATGWRRLWKGLGLMLFIWGAAVLVGLALGNRDVLQPLRGPGTLAGGPASVQPAGEPRFRIIKTTADLDRAVAAAARQGKGVMLDFYADWCTECHRMDRFTFAAPQVRRALADVVLLRADVTANDAADKALLKRFGLLGPPTILFFGPDGRERSAYRVMGYMSPDDFARHVRRALGGG